MRKGVRVANVGAAEGLDASIPAYIVSQRAADNGHPHSGRWLDAGPRPIGLPGRPLRRVETPGVGLRPKSLLCYTALDPVPLSEGCPMSVDAQTVRRIAHLARIAVADEEVEHLQGELNAILAFVEQLSELDVSAVEPMTSVIPIAMKKREDVVADGGIADAIVRNAPAKEDHYFVVPKVVE